MVKLFKYEHTGKVILLLLILLKVFSSNAQDANNEEQVLLQKAKQYRYGIVFDTAPKKAATIYMKLARQGSLTAMNELGGMYLNGDGIERNVKYAYNLFKKAADCGHIKAKCNLALIFLKGYGGIRTQYKKAFELYMQAAEAGSASGMYGVGYMYYKGIGVDQNYEKALEYLKKGAELKHSGCTFLLAIHYANGYNGDQNFQKAEDYLNLSSEYGNDLTVDVSRQSYIDSIKKEKVAPIRLLGKDHNIKYVLKDILIPTSDIHDFIGVWKGKAYTFDWSGKQILKSTDVNCRFEEEGDSVAVYVYNEDSLLTIYTPFRKNSYYLENKRKSYQKGFKWVITKSHFKLYDNKLYVSIDSRNNIKREPQKPIVWVLEPDNMHSFEKDNTATITDMTYDGQEFNVNFSCRHTGILTISFYDIAGRLAGSHSTAITNTGNNCIKFCSKLHSGIYTVIFSYLGTRKFNKITIK